MMTLAHRGSALMRRFTAMLVAVALVCVVDAGGFSFAHALSVKAGSETCWAKKAAAPSEAYAELSSFDATPRATPQDSTFHAVLKAMYAPMQCVIDFVMPSEPLAAPSSEKTDYSETFVHVRQGLVPSAQPKPPRRRV